MTHKLLFAAAALTLAASALPVAGANAQSYNYKGPPPTADQGFSFQGDQIQPMPDTRSRVTADPRYSQTQQQQATGELPKPGGGCLRYGAVGAAGGHLAGHGVLGALAGCVTGTVVRRRDEARIRAQQAGQ